MIQGNDIDLGFLDGGDGRGRTARRSLTLPREARGKHLYVVGATGTGKSKFLEHLIRQDVLAWPASRCGLMVLDRHGALYDDLMGWVAANDLRRHPVVPIDLRRQDWVVSYNLLRDRGSAGDPAVVVGNFVRAIVHAWGQGSTNETPRLAKWLRTILTTLYENRFTLAEALHLIKCPDVRHAMAANVEDALARSVWEIAGRQKESEFLEEVESTVNRLGRFLSTQVMRATLCQSEASLDLGAALEEGSILLVSMATEGTRIDDEDSATFGSLLLSDLWTAAKSRGKRDEGEGGVKPFYVYADEFQEYVTPAMAKTLDQARGFGIHMTLAHQYPSQLLDQGEQGRMVFNSVMANARSKVVFQLDHPQDLPVLALALARQEIDPERVKHQHYSTKVLGHELQYLPSYSTGTSDSHGGGASESFSEGSSHGFGESWGHTDAESTTFTEGWGESEGETYGVSLGSSTSDGHNRDVSSSSGTSEGQSSEESQSEGWSEGGSTGLTRQSGTSRGTSRSDGTSSGQSDGTSLSLSGRVYDRERDVLEDGEFEDQDFDETYDDPGSLRQSWGVSTSDSTGTNASRGSSESESQSEARSSGTSSGHSGGRGLSRGTQTGRSQGESVSSGVQSGRSRSEGLSAGISSGRSRSGSDSQGVSSSDSFGGSESWGTQESRTHGTNTSWSRGSSRSTSHAPVLVPLMGPEASAPQFRGIEEQLFLVQQAIAGQADRRCFVKLVGHKLPVRLVTPTVAKGLTTAEWALAWSRWALADLPYALRMPDALGRLAEREKGLVDRLLERSQAGEPRATGRPVGSAVDKAIVTGVREPAKAIAKRRVR